MNKKISICFLTMFIMISSLIGVNAANSNNPIKEMSNLVVFVRFKDDGSNELNKTIGNKKIYDSIHKLYMNSEEMHGGVDSSFQKYIEKMSFGQLKVNHYFPQIEGVELPVLELSKSLSQTSEYDIIEEVIVALNNGAIKSDGFGKMDFVETGFLDNLSVIIQYDKPVSNNNKLLWPHKSQAMNTTLIKGQYQVGNYNFINSYDIYNSKDNAVNNQQGVLVHEFLHSVGLKDLYNNEDGRRDVGKFDLMAQSGRFPSYLLAYNRHELGWLDIDKIHESGTYTLDKPTSENGNQAYIIETPLSSSEFFVVEYRSNMTEKGDDFLQYGFDRLYYDGLVVYRVNKNVPDKTNIGKTPYIYVYRPGDSGFNTGDGDLNYAQIAPSDGYEKLRRSLGSNDMNEINDTIYYASGQNSGLVLNNVRIQGNQLTFDLSMPDYEEMDIWKTAGNTYGDFESVSNISTTVFNNNLISNFTSMQYVQGSSKYYIETKQLKDNQWINLSSNKIEGQDSKLFVLNNKLYMIYLSIGQFEPMIAVLKDGEWKNIGELNGRKANYFDVVSDGTQAYIVCGEFESDIGYYLYDFKNDVITYKTKVSSNNLARMSLSIIDNKVALLSSVDNQTKLLLYDGTVWQTIYTSSLSYTNTHLLQLQDGKLYMLIGNQNNRELVIYKDGDTLKRKDFLSGENISQCEMKVIGDDVYLAIYQGIEGVTKVYKYSQDSFVQFGTNLNSQTKEISLTNYNNSLYVGIISAINNISYYQRVLPEETKNTNNDLKSLTILGYNFDFSETILDYTINVGYDVNAIDITAIAKESKSTVLIQKPNSFTTGNNDIKITVTSESGLEKVYTVHVLKAQAPIPQKSNNNYLSSLQIEGYSINFNKDKLNYTIQIPYSVSNLNVYTQSEDSKAKVTVNKPSSLSIGSNTITISVLSESEIVRTYQVVAIRENPPLTQSTLEQEFINNGLRIERGYIKGFHSSLNINKIVSQLMSKGYDITVKDSKDNIKDFNTVMKTKDKFVCIVNGQTYTYITIIKGDVNGDGKISSIDYLMIKDKIMGKLSFDNIQEEAANINADTKVSSIDYLMIKDSIMGKITINQ